MAREADGPSTEKLPAWWFRSLEVASLLTIAGLLVALGALGAIGSPVEPDPATGRGFFASVVLLSHSRGAHDVGSAIRVGLEEVQVQEGSFLWRADPRASVTDLEVARQNAETLLQVNLIDFVLIVGNCVCGLSGVVLVSLLRGVESMSTGSGDPSKTARAACRTALSSKLMKIALVGFFTGAVLDVLETRASSDLLQRWALPALDRALRAASQCDGDTCRDQFALNVGEGDFTESAGPSLGALFVFCRARSIAFGLGWGLLGLLVLPGVMMTPLAAGVDDSLKRRQRCGASVEWVWQLKRAIAPALLLLSGALLLTSGVGSLAADSLGVSGLSLDALSELGLTVGFLGAATVALDAGWIWWLSQSQMLSNLGDLV
jgi:hypothetical protein